ncbi:MAG: homocysteine S-methyltransferase [Planctomycetes bacterium]|nr:homocysteine S-methyltransferase [Planctomycetota bacterium]
MNPFLALLEGARPFLLDGGLATELEARGADLSDELWSGRVLLDDPEAIYRVHRDFLAAGARVITTASYQLSNAALRRRGLNDTVIAEVWARSIRLARRARDDGAMGRVIAIAGSLGSFGACRGGGAEYRGDYALTETEAWDFHRPRARALLEDSEACDVLAFETMPQFAEIRGVARGLGADGLGPAWLSFSVDATGRNLADGTPLREVAEMLRAEASVVAWGVNCCHPDQVAPALEELRIPAAKPRLAYPNSGEVWRDHRWYEGRGAGDLPGWIARWLALGVLGIGGCCRTTPGDLKVWDRILGT